jgi:hypothetical protein
LLAQDLPIEVNELLLSYADVFAQWVSFPPPRGCSHFIPLLPDARLVNKRPYRYAPVLKDEIEHQVNEMLDADLIQQSDSPFFSQSCW